MLGVGFALSVASAQAATKEAPQINYEPNVPVIFLDAKEQVVSDRKVACKLRIVFPKGQPGGTTNALPGVVRFHGASSQAFAKKSFAVTLDAPTALLGMNQSPHWVLNAAYIDRSLMRHKLSYDLFRSLSTTAAPRFAAASRFVEVNFNGDYQGAYLLMERVDRIMFGLRPYNSNEIRHACVYKAIDHAANFSQPGHGGYEQREPDPLALAYWQPLDSLNKFVSSAPDAQFFDPVTGIASRLDLDNAIDFHLLVLLTSNMDGITKNFIVAADAPAASSVKPRFFFAPWDYDATFGRNWDATVVPPSAWLANHLFDRLLDQPAYRDKFAARWNELRKRAFSAKTIQAMIDNNVRELGPAVQRNAARWPTSTGPYPDRLAFAEDIAQMKLWAEARVKWLDEEIGHRVGAAH